MVINNANQPSVLPRALRGFDHVKRYWDKTNDKIVAKILPGELYVTKIDEIITTVLGSCISACIRDPYAGIGGMNHFMLPISRDRNILKSKDPSAAARYGNFAMEQLINAILKHGGKRENLEVKLFGGGQVLANMTDIGKKNIEFVLDYLQVEGLKLITEDLGDRFPRKIQYDPLTGRVRMKKLRTMHNNTIATREEAYMHEIEDKPTTGEIELF